MTMAATSTGTAVLTLPTDTTIHVVREFDAPRHLVYRAGRRPSSSSAGGAASGARSRAPRSTCGSVGAGGT